jgi:hypothetical protein
MGVTSFPQPVNLPQGEILKAERKDPDWLGIAVGSTFLAGALLLLSGKKKAGLAVTAGAWPFLSISGDCPERWNTEQI